MFHQAALEGAIEPHALVVREAPVVLLGGLEAAIPTWQQQSIHSHGLQLLLLSNASTSRYDIHS